MPQKLVKAMADGADGHEVLEGQAHDAFWTAVQDIDTGNGSAVALKASVLLDKAGEAMEHGERLAAQHGLHAAVVSEAGTGILRFYFRADDGADRTTPLAEVVDSLRAFALQAKGSLVVLQAPVAVKERVDVWGPPGKGFAMMRGLKEQFDPGNILNPGRFVQGL